MKWTGLIIAGLAVLVLGVAGYASLATKPATVPSAYVTERVLTPPTVQELLDAVNAERAKAGVAPLTLLPTMMQSAQWKADDMQTRNYFAHTDPDTGKNNGLDYFDSIDDGSCSYVSENYHWATGPARTVTGAMRGWMNSKPHHDAILNPEYSTTGFGIAWGEKMIIVQHFCIAK